MNIKNYTKKDDGLTAVEASIVVPIVLMVIMVMMYLGFILYQQTLMQVVVNETAASMGQIYSTKSKDPFIGFTKPKTLSDTSLYRGIENAVNGLGAAHGSMDSSVEKKAIRYAKHRLQSSRLYKESGGITVDVKFEKVPGSIMQKSIIITGIATYDLPFVKFFGIMDSTIKVAAVGRAQCFDILDSGSTVSVVSSLMKETLDVAAPEIADVVTAIRSFMAQYFI